MIQNLQNDAEERKDKKSQKMLIKICMKFNLRVRNTEQFKASEDDSRITVSIPMKKKMKKKNLHNEFILNWIHKFSNVFICLIYVFNWAREHFPLPTTIVVAFGCFFFVFV